jgi:hypothetical protein
MEYMIDKYNPNAHKIDFNNSIFNETNKPEDKTQVVSEGFLSEAAQENILKTDIKNQNKFKLQENFIKNGMSKVLTQTLFKTFYDSI